MNFWIGEPFVRELFIIIAALMAQLPWSTNAIRSSAIVFIWMLRSIPLIPPQRILDSSWWFIHGRKQCRLRLPESAMLHSGLLRYLCYFSCLSNCRNKRRIQFYKYCLFNTHSLENWPSSVIYPFPSLLRADFFSFHIFALDSMCLRALFQSFCLLFCSHFSQFTTLLHYICVPLTEYFSRSLHGLNCV